MSQAIIENFSKGLDTRRSNLSSALGVLERAVNCHINPGGEIEKRKAFVPLDITPTEASGVSVSLGFEALRDYMVVFGGEENEDPQWPGLDFIYQRLYRPATDASPTEINAVRVIWSTVFNGKTFVIAQMSDGYINAFYDAELVKDINYSGLILPNIDSNLKFYYMIIEGFEDVEGYTAELNNADPLLATGVIITGTAGREFTITAEGTGTFEDDPPTTRLLNTPTSGQQGKKATGSFTIEDFNRMNSPSTIKINSIKIGGASGTELLSSAVGLELSPSQAAADVAEAINLNSSSGFTAENSGATVLIYAEDTGIEHNGEVLRIETQGKVLIGHVEFQLRGNKFTVDSIKAGGTELMNAPVAYDSSTGSAVDRLLATLASNVVAQIDIGTGTHGWFAISRDNIVKLGKNIVSSASDDTIGDNPADQNLTTVTVSITPDIGGEIVNNDNSTLTIAWSATVPKIYQILRNKGFSKEPVGVSVSGGTPPYTYKWEAVDINTTTEPAVINFVTPNASSTQIEQTNIPQTTEKLLNLRASIRVTVTDSFGNVGTSPIRQITFIMAQVKHNPVTKQYEIVE